MSKNEFFCVYDHETQSINSNKKIRPLNFSSEIFQKHKKASYSSTTKKTNHPTVSFSPVKKLKPISQNTKYYKKKKLFPIFFK